jgi:hypothetical protein
VQVRSTNIKGNSELSDAGNGGAIITYADPPFNLVEDFTTKSATSIGLTWTAPMSDGGSAITSYRISKATEGGSYSVLANSATTSFTALSLTAGVTYQFKVQAQNAHGLSAYSESISILCAYFPDPPEDILTENYQDKVAVTWATAAGSGYPLLEYKLYFVGKDGQTYALAGDECDGASQFVLLERVCYISLATLTAAPFSLVQDDSVFVRIVTRTDYGDSVLSDPANGAIIWRVPDAPVSLQDDPTVTEDTRIKIVWSAGANSGSTPVIDYTVYYD